MLSYTCCDPLFPQIYQFEVAMAFFMDVLHPYACMSSLPNHPPPFTRHVSSSCDHHFLQCSIFQVIVWLGGLGRYSVGYFPFVSSCFTCDIQHSHGCPWEKWTKLNLTDLRAFITSALRDVEIHSCCFKSSGPMINLKCCQYLWFWNP